MIRQNSGFIREATEKDRARFWIKVKRSKGCWLWTGGTAPTGYGRFAFRRLMLPAHRVSYELLVGPIPDGLVLDHLCRVRNCVNPDHLEPVTQRENILRGEARFNKGGELCKANLAKTHCPQGHPYDGENLYVYPNGKRRCRTCKRAGQLAGYYKKVRHKCVPH